MTTRTRMLFFILCLVPGTLRPRQAHIGTWKIYTDMKSVNALSIRGSSMWAATGGGVFAYDTASGVYSRFTSAEGLSGFDMRALAVDPQERVWVGAGDGAINVFDGSWRIIADIQQSNRINKRIQSFVVRGDSMLIVSDFGVSVFSMSRWEFADTYANFGFGGQELVQAAALYGGRLWVGTSLGIAFAPANAPDLSGPTPWTVVRAFPGMSPSVTALAVFHDTLVVGTASGVAYYDGAGFSAVGALAGRSVTGFAATATRLLILSSQSGGYRVESLSGVQDAPAPLASNSSASASDVLLDGNGSLWVGTLTRGIARLNGGGWSYVFPNGPNSNQFISLAVDQGGVVWAASGTDGGGKGFYRFNPAFAEGMQWKNFTAALYPIMQFDDYYKVRLGANGSVWVCSWGGGVVHVVSDSIVRKLDARSTPALPSTVPTDPYYPVVGGVAVDPDGYTWLTVRTAVNGNALGRLTTDSTIDFYRNLYSSLDRCFQELLIDPNGTKWIANAEPNQKSQIFPGLYYFNERNAVSGTQSTGGWGLLSMADGLTTNTVLCLAEDLDGNIWVGLDLGVAIITDTRNPKSRRSTSFPLREQSVQTIAVDAVNNKWVGTKEGVFVMNSDGTQLLAHYDVLSTGGRLIDNDVRAIAIDQGRGIVYFGTEKGLSSLEVAPVQTHPEMDELTFAPNPFLVPNDTQVVIQGLTANSAIKILTVSGSLVAEFKAQGGGRAFWDGRDKRGSFVASGMYIVVAHADNGSNVAGGKLAVIRR